MFTQLHAFYLGSSYFFVSSSWAEVFEAIKFVQSTSQKSKMPFALSSTMMPWQHFPHSTQNYKPYQQLTSPSQVDWSELKQMVCAHFLA